MNKQKIQIKPKEIFYVINSDYEILFTGSPSECFQWRIDNPEVTKPIKNYG